ncbi:uncharacterized protein EKO05_0010351 [Ascochyta rabiei]|uniref:Uncharacterized protein n=1 Tax=Didymella rabiei TaxID=5454 RepID=A0A162WFL0_DIDRA|nr:uncharacterized protein EKO05_0010351 [Ascochyta rabiei]KZM18994.1 hypothetical protein ST47_g9849 [Ascochyta rabiei]UPX20107.1 hypothetical protein EKO05_0010351 [Ascochyta rabiei]
MGWTSRYGNQQANQAAPVSNLNRIIAVLGGLVLATLFLGCVAFFPLTVLFAPKPQLSEYRPAGVFCATCKALWEHNRDLFNRADIMCYGPPTYDRPTRKNEEVMFGEMKRCWVLQEGHDEWLRPLGGADGETRKNLEREVRAIVLRG